MIEFVRYPIFLSTSLEPEFGVERWFRILSGKVYKTTADLRVKHMKGEKACNS